MNLLDMRTVLTSNVLSTFLCAGIIGSLWLKSRRHSEGTGLLFASMLTQLAAVVAIALRGIMWVPLSIMLGSPLVVGGSILILVGLQRYVGARISLIPNLAFLAALVVAQAFFTFARPSLQARNILLSLGLLVVCLECSWLPFRAADRSRRGETRVVATVLAAYVAVSIARMIADFAVPPAVDLFGAGLYDALVVLVYQWLLVSLTFALLLMVNRRLISALERDIAERGRAERALRESKEKFSLAFRTSPYALTITRAADGRLLELNDSFCSITGYAREEALERSSLELGLWFDPSERHWMLTALEEGKRVAGREIMFRRKDGATITCLFSAALFALGGERCILSSIADISERKRSEEALRESEERFRRLFEESPVGYQSLDTEGILLDVNPAWLSQLGYSRGEVIGRPFADFLTSPGRESFARRFQRFRERGMTHGSEYEMVCRSGTVLTMAFDGVFVRDPQRKTSYTHCVLHNITDRKKAEETIRQRSEELETMFEALPAFICMTLDPLCSHITGNRAASELAGLGAGADLSRMARDTRQAGRVELFRQDGTEYLPTELPLQQAIARGAAVRNERVEFRLPDGRQVFTLGNAAPLFDAGGEVRGAIAAFTDITELTRAEAETKRLMAAVEQAGEIIFMTDATGDIEYINPAFEHATGYTRREILGSKLGTLVSAARGEAFCRNLWATISSGGVWNGRIAVKRKDGTELAADSTISPVRGAAGTIGHYVAAMRDVSEELKLEAELRQAQKMESVGRLAGGVAHDHNNMLQVILSYARIASSKTDTLNPVHGYLGEIIKAAERSTELTSQLLAFARKQVIAPRVLDLNEVVDSMLAMLRRLIGEDIDLVWMPASQLWKVNVDPAQIGQILTNLCVNARDAISQVGTITIATARVTLDEAFCASRQGFAPGDFVQLSIRDTGTGMDAETLAKIFEPFFTTKEEGRGTGLGLATVYGIVNQNGGSIDVASEPEKGSTFTVYLPRYEGSSERPHGQILPEAPPGRGETILVVEDEAAILELSAQMLLSLGYTVLSASTPEEAIARAEARSEQIDLLLTDVIMPEMNGRTLYERLRELFPKLLCMYMSGYTAEVITHRGVLDDRVHFIQKPFTAEELATKLRSVLEGPS